MCNFKNWFDYIVCLSQLLNIRSRSNKNQASKDILKLHLIGNGELQNLAPTICSSLQIGEYMKQ